MGIQPDIIVCRTDLPLEPGIKEKIALFCNVDKSHVLENMDVDILYEVPLALEDERIAQVACECLGLPCPEPDLSEWSQMCKNWKNPSKSTTIALVGKYTQLHDAYISVVEALKAGGAAHGAEVNIKWIDSEELTKDNADEILSGVNGIIVPGGFGERGIDGMITAAGFARENNIPYLGICLGMQIALIEFARNVLGLKDAHSCELDPDTTNPVIHLMPDQENVSDLGGTLRLGSYPCVLSSGSKAEAAYGTDKINERHRHRYEVNNDYRDELISHGCLLSGVSPDNRIVEMIELADHPWFVATQAHPEFKSRPNRPHPLFKAFIEAGL